MNSCCSCRISTNPIVVSASDDASIRLWDIRSKRSQTVMRNAGNYQVLAVAFNDIGSHVFSSGIDEKLKAWDLRKPDEPVWTVSTGHTDTVTGMSLSPDGTQLLTNCMDNVVRTWDVRPFVAGGDANRLGATAYSGATHNYEKLLLRCSWAPDGKRVSAGSSDNNVYVWDTATASVQYKLPGHKGSVCEVAFHPNEPIIASGGVDKQIFLGELH